MTMPTPESERTASTTSTSLLQSTKPRWSKVGPRDRWWLIGFTIFSLAVLVAWRPVRREIMMTVALRSDAPSDAILSELTEGSPPPAQTLERMWCSGNLAARRFVMEYVKGHLHAEPMLASRLQSIVGEAARDPDLSVRESVMSILADDRRADFQILLRQQLRDADPAVRVLALQQLQRSASSNNVAMAAQLLNDSDARVIVQAALLLRKATGMDFGIRASHALPRFARSEESPLPLFNLDAIEHGARQWRDWWKQHREEFPPPPALSPPLAVAKLPAKEFTLEDSEGRLVHLSDFRGKTVLLCFWKTGSAASFDDVPTLQELQKRESQRLVVVGVAFDPSVGPQDDCGGEGHGDGNEHQHGHAHASDSHAHCGVAKPDVQALVTRMSIIHPVLLDTEGTLVFRYNAQEVATYVLIDAEGNLRRRFAGSRTLQTWTTMVEEIASH